MPIDRISDFRSVYAQVVCTRARVEDPRLRAAFARVPRHEFLGPGPWMFSESGPPSPSDDPALVYQDVGIGLDPQTPTGTPSLHAMCIDACRVAPGESISHVGAGTGYYSAILAELAGESGRVVGYELEATRITRASAALAHWPQLTLLARSGLELEPGSWDLIYVSAGVQQIPQVWLSALNLGGRLLLPLTGTNSEGGMLLFERTGPEVYGARWLGPARFVPCIGAQDERAGAALAAAFARGGAEHIRALHTERPRASVWFEGDGWWLTRAPDEVAAAM